MSSDAIKFWYYHPDLDMVVGLFSEEAAQVMAQVEGPDAYIVFEATAKEIDAYYD